MYRPYKKRRIVPLPSGNDMRPRDPIATTMFDNHNAYKHMLATAVDCVLTAADNDSTSPNTESEMQEAYSKVEAVIRCLVAIVGGDDLDNFTMALTGDITGGAQQHGYERNGGDGMARALFERTLDAFNTGEAGDSGEPRDPYDYPKQPPEHLRLTNVPISMPKDFLTCLGGGETYDAIIILNDYVALLARRFRFYYECLEAGLQCTPPDCEAEPDIDAIYIMLAAIMSTWKANR